MNNKILILSMSCNNPVYESEEKIVLETWGNDIINGKYDNISLYFFTSGTEDKIDESNHKIYVDAFDDLSHTYEKTSMAYKMCLNTFDFDWIILTNTATVLNIPLINRLANSGMLDEEKYYGCELLLPLRMVAFFRGNFIMLSKKVIKSLDLNYHGIAPNDVFIFEQLDVQNKVHKKFLQKFVQLKSIVDFKMFSIDEIGSNFAISTKIFERKNHDIIKSNIIGSYYLLKSDENVYDLNEIVYEPRFITTNNGLFKVEKFYDL